MVEKAIQNTDSHSIPTLLGYLPFRAHTMF